MTSTLRTRTQPGRRAVLAHDGRPVAIFLYTRISQDREGRELGVKRQTADLNAWVQREYPDAMVFAGYCDNDKSASTVTNTFRPDYEKMLDDARETARSGQFSRVIIAAYTDSRLTRRPRENEDLIELAEGFGVVYSYLRSPQFDLNTADGREYARGAAARNAGEVERMKERILDAKRQYAIDGAFAGGACPFGYTVEYDYNSRGLPIKPGRLIVVEREAKAIRWGVDHLLAGGSLREITRRWTAEGLRTPKGNLWNPTGVRRVLERGRNAGLSERLGEYMGQGQWPTIISEEELRAVRMLLRNPARRTHHGAYVRKFLGSGVYLCGQPGCTSSMRSAGRRQGANTKFECRENAHCSIDAEPVDAYVRTVVAEYIDTHNATMRVVESSGEAERLEREATKLAALLTALDDEFNGGQGEMTGRAYAVQSRKLEERLAEIAKEQAEAIVPERIMVGVERGADFLATDLAHQRAIVQHLVTVTILPGRRGGRGERLISDRVRVEPAEPVAA